MIVNSIEVNNISKVYRIGTESARYDTFAESVSSWILRPVQNYQRIRKMVHFNALANDKDVIWALRDVSFSVAGGEVVGVIGRNGAGKSTLLKILSRITHPTSGSFQLKGRVSSLLEVGTGFHPELTGRENIYLNGTILGMMRGEIDEKFDEIVDFSGVKKYIDTPVKFYSSGMGVRLAFSVAAHLDPEILLVDEVLAVGDAEFQNKCLGKMEDVASRGRTVIFVSHNMSAINRLCKRGIWLEEGKIAADGPVDKVIQSYLYSGLSEFNPQVSFHEQEDADGQILKVEALDLLDQPSLHHLNTNPFSLRIHYRFNKEIVNYRLGVIIRTPDGYEVLTKTTADQENALWTDGPGNYSLQVEFPGHLIRPGQYLITVFLGQPGIRQLDKKENCIAIDLDGKTFSGQGLIIYPLKWKKESISS